MDDECPFVEGMALALPSGEWGTVVRVSPSSVAVKLDETYRVVHISRQSEGVAILPRALPAPKRRTRVSHGSSPNG